MPACSHFKLLLQGVAVWFGFWLAGLPAYYQQYSTVTLAAGCVFLSVVVSLLAVAVLRASRPAIRMSRALWISFYYTIPFALLDGWYCGVYLGHGPGFLATNWYLTVFYFTPWLTFAPTAMLLGHAASARGEGKRGS